MAQPDWSDLQLCLAIAEHGSFVGAAKQLGLSHSTILRRLTNLEAHLRTRLFDRYPRGAQPTEDGDKLVRVADKFRNSIGDVFMEVSGRNTEMRGHVRIATADQIAVVIMEQIVDFARTYPEVELDLHIAQDVQSATLSESHITILLSNTPPDGHIGFRVGPVAFAPYGSRDILGSKQQSQLPWVGHAPSLRFTYQGQLDEFVQKQFRCVHRTNSITSHLNALRSGLGVGLLPYAVGDREASLERCGPRLTHESAELWVLYRSDVSKDGVVTVLAKDLQRFLQSQANQITGVAKTSDICRYELDASFQLRGFTVAY